MQYRSVHDYDGDKNMQATIKYAMSCHITQHSIFIDNLTYTAYAIQYNLIRKYVAITMSFSVT